LPVLCEGDKRSDGSVAGSLAKFLWDAAFPAYTNTLFFFSFSHAKQHFCAIYSISIYGGCYEKS